MFSSSNNSVSSTKKTKRNYKEWKKECRDKGWKVVGDKAYFNGEVVDSR